MVFILEYIPTKLLKTNFSFSTEALFIELNLRRKKWLLCCNPNKSNIGNHLSDISKNLDPYLCKYDNILLMGDYNAETTEAAMNDFLEAYSLQNLVKNPTCFKNPIKPSTIDLILTNSIEVFVTI